MIESLNIGALVRRIEPPINGLATVAAVDAETSPPCILLTYAEGGEGWWPLDCIAPADPVEG
jgi:hypothetical protein